jgi:hypothetical protein
MGLRERTEKFMADGPSEAFASRLLCSDPQYARYYYLARWAEASRAFGIFVLVAGEDRAPWIPESVDAIVRPHVRLALGNEPPDRISLRALYMEVRHALVGYTRREGRYLVARVLEEEKSGLGPDGHGRNKRQRVA